jgi:hypothetical protein
MSYEKREKWKKFFAAIFLNKYPPLPCDVITFLLSVANFLIR